jgi:hypothetical protein
MNMPPKLRFRTRDMTPGPSQLQKTYTSLPGSARGVALPLYDMCKASRNAYFLQSGEFPQPSPGVYPTTVFPDKWLPVPMFPISDLL